VIMIGEIRDLDTAKTALQASITGHLVLGTFHADTAASAFSRWEERAADSYAMTITGRLTPGAAQAAAQAFQVLGERSYSYPSPSPLLVFWSYSHPPLAQRIRFVLSATSKDSTGSAEEPGSGQEPVQPPARGSD